MLYVETADRSGLLMEVVKIMADINIQVESAEIDTEVSFFCSHRAEVHLTFAIQKKSVSYILPCYFLLFNLLSTSLLKMHRVSLRRTSSMSVTEGQH